ncbi:MAG: leucyl aminopeptidase family protein [Pseudomonadota bacterium]
MDIDRLTPYAADVHETAKPIIAFKEDDDRSSIPSGLAELAEANGFKGDIGSVLVGAEGVLVGVGKGDDPFALAAASEKLPAGDYRLDASFDDHALYGGEAALFAWLLGGYRFDRYKSATARPARLVAPEGVDIAAAQRQAEAVALARDLVNTPAVDMLPDALEAAARGVAERFGASFEAIVGDDLLTQNFPMIHAVGRASAVAPRLLDFSWGPVDAPKLTLIGKGVCFDSGGLNIKPGGSMALMKKDMGGAANTLALAHMIMANDLPVRLRVLIPAVENAISGSSFRPGDILQSRAGLTVEIGNTDAEGRLVLADAMTYASEDPPEMMFTLATLTGAARVALGPDVPPFYCDDEALAAGIIAGSEAAHDPVWRMPLWPGYRSMLSSPIADMNSAPASGFAGSITAALFLKRFASEDVPWAHFDMYAWRPKAAPGRPIGGEAQAVRGLYHLFAERYASA